MSYFNPHLPCGRWLRPWGNCVAICKFQSTPSLRKVTKWGGLNGGIYRHFNPHLPCGRWHTSKLYDQLVGVISIHTFLAEGDPPQLTVSLLYCGISIHTFLAEGDCLFFSHNKPPYISIHTFLAEGDGIKEGFRGWSWFQSTPSLRKVTWSVLSGILYLSAFQSTPSLRKVTITRLGSCGGARQFQSTPSLRKVTPEVFHCFLPGWISIHTFLAEGDAFSFSESTLYVEFQSTPSLRKVTCPASHTNLFELFQSTPSLRKVTS